MECLHVHILTGKKLELAELLRMPCPQAYMDKKAPQLRGK
jgi:hypothetical protein